MARAQAPITFQYFYDEVGQLAKVVDSTGNVVEYVYDEVGNILEIKRSTVSGLAIIDFAPKRGPIGATVTIQGQSFSPTPNDNTVTFNGTTATVTSATATTLVTTVPLGATTGPIAVTVRAETATSSQDFVITTPPVITAVYPAVVLKGITVERFLIEGANFTDSAFSFIPGFSLPNGIAIDSVSIDPSGISATLSLTVGTDATGNFVLVATNAEGSSDTASTLSNTVNVVDLNGAEDADMDGLTNAEEVARGTNLFNPDTDGDGFVDGLEVALESNPLDPDSIPDPTALISEAVTPTSSILNAGNPTGVNLPDEAVGATSSLSNTENATGPSNLPGEAVGPTFSVENLGSP